MNKASRSETIYRESDEEGYKGSNINYGLPLNSKEAGHPFEMCIATISAGMALCGYHSHTTQWEFYYVLSGAGHVRLEEGNGNVLGFLQKKRRELSS